MGTIVVIWRHLGGLLHEGLVDGRKFNMTGGARLQIADTWRNRTRSVPASVGVGTHHESGQPVLQR